MERETLLDKYVQGTLSPSEQKEFDTLLKEDPDFKTEIELIENIAVISGVEDRSALRKTLQEFESKIETNTSQVIPLIPYKKWLVAASIILIALIGGIAVFNPFDVNTDTLYASNFEPYKNVVTPIIRGESEESEEIEAFTAYESGDYPLAVTKFEQVYQKTQKSYLLLYQANALLASNRTADAIPLLEKHVTLNDRLSDRGKWYLALAYIKNKQQENAIPILENIVEKKTFKSSDAAKLLKDLK